MRPGGSGDNLRLLVEKTAETRDRRIWLQMQAAYAASLGEGSVCPRILGHSPKGYSMEYLTNRPVRSDDIREIEKLLSEKVWCRRSWVVTPGWDKLLEEFIGGPVPVGIRVEPTQLVHGDPTLSNLLWDGDSPRLTDPLRPEGKTPPLVSIDKAALLQSMCGWEVITTGDTLETGRWFEEPDFLATDAENETLWRSIWWLGVKVRRIIPYRRGDLVAQAWCSRVLEGVNDILSADETVIE